MAKRSRMITATTAVLAAVLFWVLGSFLARQGLDHAAAWSNIIALPVALVGVVVGILALLPPFTQGATDTVRRPEKSVVGSDRPAGTSRSVRGPADRGRQVGVGLRDQFNVVEGNINITNHDR